MMKTIKNILFIGLMIFTAWFMVSYIDIILHNLDNPPVYKDWNLIIRLMEMKG